MSDFDDRSGIVACVTPWGRWWQTVDDLTVEVNVPDGCRAKEIQCSVTPHSLSLAVKGNTVFKVLETQLYIEGNCTLNLHEKHTLRTLF